MGADADAASGAGYGERSPERVNCRNRCRERDWDTRVGSIELAVPKPHEGSYSSSPLSRKDFARITRAQLSPGPPQLVRACPRLALHGRDGQELDRLHHERGRYWAD